MPKLILALSLIIIALDLALSEKPIPQFEIQEEVAYEEVNFQKDDPKRKNLRKNPKLI
jgi:hypothetical protein